MTDVLRQLQRAAWRKTIEFPVSHREFGFAQDQAKHRYIFRDNQVIESLGRENPTWRYTIPFREDITVGGWTNLFTRVYPDFLAACQDRSRGQLTDPLHGTRKAKCVSFREIVDVNRRDGVDVEVEFIYAPEETDFEFNLGTQIRTLQGYESHLRRFDNELSPQLTALDSTGRLRDLRDVPLAQPRGSLNPLDAITAAGGQALLVQGKVDGALADSAFRLEKSVETIDRLRNPSLASTRTQARRLQGAALDLQDRVDPVTGKPLRKMVTASNITVAALAGKLGITLELLLKWNPALRRSPLVKANTEIRVSAEVLAKSSRG